MKSKKNKKKMKGGMLRRNSSCESLSSLGPPGGGIQHVFNSPTMSCTSQGSSNSVPVHNNFNWNNTSCCVGMGGLGASVGYNYMPMLMPFCGPLGGATTGCLFGTAVGYDCGYGHSKRKKREYNLRNTCSSYPRKDACFNLY